MFYYYSNRSIPVGRFQNRTQWQGDISRWDGSIQLQNVQVNDSGTYVCEIRLLRCSSIFKNHTVLHVSPMEQRGMCPATAPLSRCPVLPPQKGCRGSERLSDLPPQFFCSPCVYHPLPLCLPSRTRSSTRPGRCGPGRHWFSACGCGLWLCGRCAVFPGWALPEEEVPTLAVGLGG